MDRDSLIAALEAATGPSRELDAFTAPMLGWAQEKRGRDRVTWWYRPDGSRAHVWYDDHPPRFTASIDAALTLVPDRFDWVLDSSGLAALLFADRAAHTGRGKSPAIAICIAALKATATLADPAPQR